MMLWIIFALQAFGALAFCAYFAYCASAAFDGTVTAKLLGRRPACAAWPGPLPAPDLG